MVESLPTPSRRWSLMHTLACCAVVAILAVLPERPASAQSCPAGQREMTFPPEGYFEFWRRTTASLNRSTEEWWYSEARQLRVERLPFANGSFSEYFDFTAQTVTIVQIAGSSIVDCTRYPTDSLTVYSRPSVGPGCFGYVSDENFGGLHPVERWVRVNGIAVSQDVFAQRVGDELIPLTLFNADSTTIYTAYLNFSPVVEDSDFEPPCTPVDGEISVTEALQEIEIQHDLPPGTLTDPETGG